LLGRAALALDRGDPTSAVELAERVLRGVPAQDRVERVGGLELLVRGYAALGDHAQAARAAVELQDIAAAIDTPPLRAAASSAEGITAVARADLEEARRRFEDAIDRYDQSGAPFEAAQVRLELARVLADLERPDAALHEAQTALATLDQIGAVGERERAANLLRDLAPTSVGPAPPLTGRELEVLRLVAAGLGDKEVAASLNLSEHTIHRHVSNILKKLDVPSRAAAVAQAARHGLL
jgi:ATP/maltotriose-dependent transcriptional regulator MalT